jgi:hypothetical protein
LKKQRCSCSLWNSQGAGPTVRRRRLVGRNRKR